MIIDCHIHYEKRIFPAERMLAAMDRHGIDEACLIPTIVEPFSLRGRVKRYSNSFLRTALVRANPVGRFLYDALLIDSKGYFHILHEKYRVIERPGDAEAAELVERHPDRFLGWIFVNPAVDPDPVKKVEGWADRPGMVGVKAHPYWHRYPVEKLLPVALWRREHDRPLLAHLGSRRGSGITASCRRVSPASSSSTPMRASLITVNPGTTSRTGRGSTWTSPAPTCPGLVRWAGEFLGPGKCLYDTDGPYDDQAPGEDYDYSWLKGRVEAFPLSGDAKEMIFSRHFLDLTGGGAAVPAR